MWEEHPTGCAHTSFYVKEELQRQDPFPTPKCLHRARLEAGHIPWLILVDSEVVKELMAISPEAGGEGKRLQVLIVCGGPDGKMLHQQ